MNIFQKIARNIIRRSFHFSVSTIEHFYDVKEYERRGIELASLPEGTLGKDIADCLKQHDLRLVPGYESHDLKHVLLDFKMTPVDEIRLQAFMLGNGNHSFPSFAIFIFGALLLPDLWRTFYSDYRTGKRSAPISGWTIEEYAYCKTSTLREVIASSPHTRSSVATSWNKMRLAGITMMIAGLFGMLFSLPYLFSSLMEDLVGAGSAFMAGAILMAGGLISVSLTGSRNRHNTAQCQIY